MKNYYFILNLRVIICIIYLFWQSMFSCMKYFLHYIYENIQSSLRYFINNNLKICLELKLEIRNFIMIFQFKVEIIFI